MSYLNKSKKVELCTTFFAFQIDTSCLLNLLKLLLLKLLIYGIRNLTFYNNMEQKGKLGYYKHI